MSIPDDQIPRLENADCFFSTLANIENPYADPSLLATTIKILLLNSPIIDGPINEEFGFRLLIQDLLLKRLPQFICKKIAPQRAKWFDSTNSKILRIAITTILFTAMHYYNKQIISDTNGDKFANMAYAQMASAVIIGIVSGILKESYGFFASLGFHMGVNLLSSLHIILQC